MVTEEIKARYRRVVDEVFNKGNVDAWDEIVASNVVMHESTMPDFKGLEAFKQAFLGTTQGFTDRKYNVEELIGEGDTTATRYSMSMKHTGSNPMVPVPATGKEVVLKGGVVHHWENGKIVEVFGYCDLLGMMQQLGLIPPMGQQ